MQEIGATPLYVTSSDYMFCETQKIPLVCHIVLAPLHIEIQGKKLNNTGCKTFKKQKTILTYRNQRNGESKIM